MSSKDRSDQPFLQFWIGRETCCRFYSVLLIVCLLSNPATASAPSRPGRNQVHSLAAPPAVLIPAGSPHPSPAHKDTVIAKPTKGSPGKSAGEIGKAGFLSDEDGEESEGSEVMERTGNDSIYQTQSALNFCKACWCNKQDSIDCRKPNQLKSIPILRDSNFRDQITEIIIENQSGFKSLDRGGLKYYQNVEKL